MGCGRSAPELVPNFNVPGQSQDVYDLFLSFGLKKKQIDKIYSIFVEMDADSSGQINRSEMYAYFNLDENALTQKIFGFFDADDSGLLNFAEFGITLWNFLTTKSTSEIVFHIADKRGQGYISPKDLRKLFEDMHKTDLNSNRPLKETYNKIMVAGNDLEKVMQDTFMKVMEESQAIFGPVFKIQESVCEQLFGRVYWLELSDVRYSDPQRNNMQYPYLLRKQLDKINADIAARLSEADRAKKLESYKRNDKGSKISMVLDYYKVGPGQKKASPERQPSKRFKDPQQKPEILLSSTEHKDPKKGLGARKTEFIQNPKEKSSPSSKGKNDKDDAKEKLSGDTSSAESAAPRRGRSTIASINKADQVDMSAEADNQELKPRKSRQSMAATNKIVPTASGDGKGGTEGSDSGDGTQLSEPLKKPVRQSMAFGGSTGRASIIKTSGSSKANGASTQDTTVLEEA